ncbi:MAG: hypothetical protein IPM25_09330 [Chloracidobacterium sp.]|nr:hypothetical protein [Chloracidobacterium sp.]
MRRSVLTLLFSVSAIALAACEPTTPAKPNTAPNSPAASPAATSSPAGSPAASPAANPNGPAAKAASFEGVWPGPDGSSMTITKTGDKFKVEITGRDKKVESFEGTAKGDTIEFKRKEKVETARLTTPEETGLKWPGGEKDCVLITKGSEGYCRK